MLTFGLPNASLAGAVCAEREYKSISTGSGNPPALAAERITYTKPLSV
jgi:hypothetical protein